MAVEPTIEATAMRHHQFNTKNKTDFNEVFTRIAASPFLPRSKNVRCSAKQSSSGIRGKLRRFCFVSPRKSELQGLPEILVKGRRQEEEVFKEMSSRRSAIGENLIAWATRKARWRNSRKKKDRRRERVNGRIVEKLHPAHCIEIQEKERLRRKRETHRNGRVEEGEERSDDEGGGCGRTTGRKGGEGEAAGARGTFLESSGRRK